MTEAERRARFKIASLSDRKLIIQWEMTGKMQNSVELAMVRGWLMDELEKRFPKGFDKWISCGANFDSDLKFFVENEMSLRRNAKRKARA